MTALELLSSLEASGVRLSVQGDNLCCKAPSKVLTPTLQSAIRNHKASLLTLLGRLQDGQEQKDGYLSSSQRRVLFVEELAPGTPLFHLPMALSFVGRLSVAALRQTLGEIVRRHHILRTTYPSTGTLARSVTQPSRGFDLPLVDLSSLDPVSQAALADSLMKQEIEKSFHLDRDLPIRGRLLRFGLNRHTFLLTRHHIASDGWSLGLLLRELAALYNAFATGMVSPLRELEIQYADHARAQQERLQLARLAPKFMFWRSTLGQAAVAFAPFPTRLDSRGDGAHGVQGAELDAALSSAVKQACRTGGHSPFNFFLAVFAVLVYEYTGQSDLVIGTDITERTQKATEALIGIFVNRLPLRLRFNPERSFGALLDEVRQAAASAYAHADLPFEQIVNLVNPERRSTGDPMFQLFFGMHSAPNHAPYRHLKLVGLRENVLLEWTNPRAHYPLCLHLSDTPDGFATELRYTGEIAPEVTHHLLAQFEFGVRLATTNPELKVEHLAVQLATQKESLQRRQAQAFQTLRDNQWKKRRLPQ